MFGPRLIMYFSFGEWNAISELSSVRDIENIQTHDSTLSIICEHVKVEVNGKCEIYMGFKTPHPSILSKDHVLNWFNNFQMLPTFSLERIG